MSTATPEFHSSENSSKRGEQKVNINILGRMSSSGMDGCNTFEIELLDEELGGKPTKSSFANLHHRRAFLSVDPPLTLAFVTSESRNHPTIPIALSPILSESPGVTNGEIPCPHTEPL